MKQIFILLLATLVLTTLGAQNPRTHALSGHHINLVEHIATKGGDGNLRLQQFYTDDNYQFNYFHYDAQGRLTDVIDTIRNEYFVIDSLTYNDQGQLVRLSGWQRLNGILKNVYYIDYTYDAAGNIATRSNYNWFTNHFELGGIYHYTYNADNLIILSTMTMSNTLYQRVEYTYDAGKLQQELWYLYDGFGLTPSEKINYYYTGDQLTQQMDSTSEDGVNWQLSTRSTYVYDAAGNCTEHHAYDYTGQEAERNLYTIDNSLILSEIWMPWTPEQVRPNTYHNHNAYTREAYYALDVNHVLQYLCDYIYVYGDPTGIVQPAVISDVVLYPNPAHGQVLIAGLGESPVQASLYDLTGRLLCRQQVSASNNRMDVTALRPGIYALVLPQATLKLLVQ